MAINYEIDATYSVKILTAPYFIATKLEAFKGRGENDGRTSQDFEDIIYVLENRQSIWEEINQLDGMIRDYLRSEFLNLLDHPYILEWIDCHVERSSPPATNNIFERLKEFTNK